MSLDDFRSVFLPYCLQKQPDGQYVVLNREYKPLGFKTRERVKYEDYPICAELKGITARIAAKVSHKGDSNTDMIFLYDDGCVPTTSAEHMQSYLKRLELLATLKID